MTTRELIEKLLKEVENLDTPVDFYIYADTEVCRKIADNDECIDDFKDISDIEERNDRVHIILKEIEY